MKYLPFRKSDLWIALGFLVCYIAIFDSKLDLGGDNAGYYILAQALHGGDGYTDIHLPGAPAAKHFPPGYPVLMAVCMAVSDSFYFLKVLNGVLFLASLLMLQRLFERMTQNQTLAWVALALTLLNAHLLRSSTILMSEIPFLFFSVATLSCLVKWRSGDKPFWQSPWFWAMLILSSISYHIRTAGLALIAGIGLYLLFEKKWAAAIGYGVGFMALALPWFMRGKALGGNPYLAQLIQVNPYRPEEGVLTLGGWVTRIQSIGTQYSNYFNVGRYVSQNLPAEAIIATYKPGLFYLYAQRP
ncbi:MAG: phospholipid carrier-dependent glycosyltransferase, partial [Cryomorphaceae bacterium]|nr:phospholipid carrier-dependent glycosyltransferase [Cryomorphaceae bacterium]